MGTSIYSQSIRGAGNNMDLQLDPESKGCWNLWLNSQSVRSTVNNQGFWLVSEVESVFQDWAFTGGICCLWVDGGGIELIVGYIAGIWGMAVGVGHPLHCHIGIGFRTLILEADIYWSLC